MARSTTVGIVSGDESAIHDEPHIEGSRITVRYVQKCVEERGLDPRAVADRYNLDVADVYAALSYYHNNPGEMRAVERRRRKAIEEAERRTTVRPPDEEELRDVLEDAG